MMSRLCHLSFLVLLASLFTRSRGQTENVTKHLRIKTQGDGTLVMSSGKGESEDNFINWQLDIDLIRILEGSERRLEFSGALTDGVTDRVVECSSSKSKVIEERRKLLRIFCPKEGDQQFQIISRSVWFGVNGENRYHTSDYEELFRIHRKQWEVMESTMSRRTKEAELLIVSVGKAVGSNFLIENDGKIFEDHGWDNVNYLYTGGLGDHGLLISFLNSGEPNHTPSEAAIRAYESLVRYAICTGRLPTDYLLIPHHLIWGNKYVEGWNETANYESNQMREWNAYTDNVDFLFPPKSDVDQELHVVSREEWKGVGSNLTNYTFTQPKSFVLVDIIEERCFRNCGKVLKLLYELLQKRFSYDDNHFNFIIAESGRVFEDLGWNRAFDGSVHGIFVVFLGRFDTFSTWWPAFNALDKIIKEGMKNGKIAPYHILVTPSQKGEGFFEGLEKYLYYWSYRLVRRNEIRNYWKNSK